MVGAVDDATLTAADRLRKLDTCAVSDALDRLGLVGGLSHLRPMTARSRRIAGPVLTVDLVPASPGVAPTAHLGTQAVELARPGDVIAVAHAGRVDASGWGGLLSLGAKRAGVEAVIVDGATRDIDEAIQLEFPIWAVGATPRTARGRVVERATNEPVMMGAVQVRPGDLVLADESGVVFVAADRCEEVIDVAEVIAGRERAIAAAIQGGAPMREAMGRNYEHMLRSGSGGAGG
jgi:4-hydroxy-4-methyl-2-oxoglutarate aldolase